MPTTKSILRIHVTVMGALLAFGALFPRQLTGLMEKPDLYRHVKFFHVLSVSLFFANTVIGTIWELRSLWVGRPEIIRHTYQTVSWLDAVFTAPLILLSVLTGLTLATILGGVWSMGWLSAAILLFLLSGLVWVTADLPSQGRLNRLFATVGPETRELPAELRRLLRRRMIINFLGFAPLAVIFFLMIHKPDIPNVGEPIKALIWPDSP